MAYTENLQYNELKLEPPGYMVAPGVYTPLPPVYGPDGEAIGLLASDGSVAPLGPFLEQALRYSMGDMLKGLVKEPRVHMGLTDGARDRLASGLAGTLGRMVSDMTGGAGENEDDISGMLALMTGYTP